MNPKPDSVTLFVTRLMASVAWSYDNRLLGMYFRLLCGLVRSERLGYLPNDVAELMKIARGNDRFFKADWQTLGRRFRQTQDGLWIYHETMLEALQAAHTKGVEQVSRFDAKPIERVVKKSFELPEALKTYFEEGYKAYPRHVGKTAAKKAFWKACRENANGSDSFPIGAAMQIVAAIKVYAGTPAGNRGSYTPHMSTWLNQGRFLDDPAEWQTGQTKQDAERRAIDEVFSR